MKRYIYNKYIFIITYLSGLLVPYLYLLFLKNMKFFFIKKIYKNKIILFLFFFLFIQLISTFLSVFSNYNSDMIRYIAIYHNYMNFLFLIFGIIWLQNSYNFIKYQFRESIRITYIFIIIVSILSFIYSLNTGNTVNYEGILSKITGVSNAYTQVNINSVGFLDNSIFPRTRLFGIYSNSAAVVIFIISIIYLIEYVNSIKTKFIFIIITLIVLATTGSRITIISFIIWSYFYIHRSRKQLFISLFIIFIVILMFYNNILNIFSYINNLRDDSSNTRFHLYLVSLSLMINENILFGLGLKPKLELIKELPIGSHSTLIGYFVKNGIIGGLYFLIGYIFIIYKFILSLFSYHYTKKIYYKFAVFSLSIIFIFEDLDAYEFVAFLSGILIYFAYIKQRS